MAFADEKAAAIEIIQAKNCPCADVLDLLLQGYPNVPTAIFNYADVLGCQPNLLTKLLSLVVVDANLTANGIYFNKLLEPLITNGIVIVDSTVTLLEITAAKEVIMIAGPTTVIDELKINNVTVGNVIVVGGAKVTKITRVTAGIIENLYIDGCDSNSAQVVQVVEQGWVGPVTVIGGGFFGGIGCLDTSAGCATEINNDLEVDKVTSLSLLLQWTNPAGSLGNLVHYKLNSDLNWLSPNSINITGHYVQGGTPKFVFRHLAPDTYYDFRVKNICADGIPSAGREITVKTSSPGSGPSTPGGKIKFVTTPNMASFAHASLVGRSADDIDFFVEGILKSQGSEADEYTFDSTLGKLTFNEPFESGGQRCVIEY